MTLYGAIEAGGTKFICTIGNSPDDIRAETRIQTTSPGETLAQVAAFFLEYQQSHGILLDSIGLACFGPVDLNPASGTYGFITSTPKPGWQQTNIVGMLQEYLNIRIEFETDTNGAAIGEALWGNARGLRDFIYITIGTGIGGGIIVDGKPLHGLVHPEIGHMRIQHDLDVDPFPGFCPFHRDCFEGLASGPAIQARWGKPGEELREDHRAWDLETRYVGTALHNLVCALSPQRIILGGGVMQQTHLFPRIRRILKDYLNSYIQSNLLIEDIDEFIVPPGLGRRAGVLGALALAQKRG